MLALLPFLPFFLATFSTEAPVFLGPVTTEAPAWQQSAACWKLTPSKLYNLYPITKQTYPFPLLNSSGLSYTHVHIGKHICAGRTLGEKKEYGVHYLLTDEIALSASPRVRRLTGNDSKQAVELHFLVNIPID